MLGYHVSKNKRSWPTAIAEETAKMQEAGISQPCCQVFFSGPRSYDTIITPDEARRLTNYNVFVHGAYVDYMNGRQESVDNIRRELALCDLAAANGLILHLGKNMQPAKALSVAMDGSVTPVYLEINAQKPPNWSDTTALFDLFTELEEQLKPDIYARLGLCIDTQHLYACGVTFRTSSDVNRYMDSLNDAFDDQIPPLMFHLNDSSAKKGDLFGTGTDRHEEIGDGSIWSSTTGGCVALMNYCKEYGLPVILESKNPEHALNNLKKIGILPF